MKVLKYSLKIAALLFSSLICFGHVINNKFGQSLTYKEGQHIPLILLLDKHNNESPSTNSIALTQTLYLGIKSKAAAILVNQSILHNLLFKKYYSIYNYFENQDINLSSNEWELYSMVNPKYFTDNQLLLLIPKSKKNLLSLGFNFKAFQQLNILPENNTKNNYINIINILEPKLPANTKKKAKYMIDDFQQILCIPSFPKNKKEKSFFIHQQEAWTAPIFDIYLAGHGLPKPDSLIADLTPNEMQKLLTFFNTKLRIGTLMICSCYAGGENLRTLKFKNDINKNEIFYPLNFLTIIQSVGDIFSYVDLRNPIDFNQIFDITKNLGTNDENGIDILLSKIGTLLPVIWNPHGDANISQIILPGGIEIQTPQANTIHVLGNVKVKTAEMEGKPFYIYPTRQLINNPKYDLKLSVLVYPKVINTPLILQASRIDPNLKLEWHYYFPTFNEINIAQLKNNHYLYPNILSMIHGNASHYFNKLIFEGNAFDGSGGIFMGIRDSFFDIVNRQTLKTFYIDILEGTNDISLILQANPPNKQIPYMNPIEAKLPAAGKKIILQNVIITTQCYNIFSMPMLSVEFQLNETAWKFESRYWSNALDFIEINLKDHQRNFNNAKEKLLEVGESKPKHKSLITLLKEKINKIKNLKNNTTSGHFFKNIYTDNSTVLN